MDNGENERIARNLFLEKSVLSLIRDHMNIFILRQLDYKIQNINTLSHDESVAPMKRAAVAIRKFGRISDSEITTPEQTASAMIDLIPDECFVELGGDADARILDIASKMGEFAVAIVKRCGNLGISAESIKDRIVSIPTSSIAYEFTRKVYEVLGLDVDSIAENFNSYDLLKVDKINEDGTLSDELDYVKIRGSLYQKKRLSAISLSDELNGIEEADIVKFKAIVGNPPYHEADGGASASAKPIYPHFVDISKCLRPEYISMIMPTRWFTGGKGLDDFRMSMLDDKHIRELHDCLHPEEIFPNTNNRGGICYFLWDKRYDNGAASSVKVVTHNGNGEIIESIRPMRTRDLNVFIRNSSALSIMDKVIPTGTSETMAKHISSRKPFGIESNIIKTNDWHTDNSGMSAPVVCYGKRMQLGYIERELISAGQNMIDKWKVYTPRANNVGTELNDDNLNTFLGRPGTICTESYIIVGGDLDLSEQSAKNLMGYFKTKFVRFMHSLAKASHDASRTTYRFVPVVDFSEKWTDEKLYAKYCLTQEEIDLIESSIKSMV